MSKYAKENTDYWAVAFRPYTNADFETTWGIDMLWKIPLPNEKDVFAKMLTSDPNDFKEPKLAEISTSFRGMALRSRFNPDIVGPYVFMADEGLWENEDDFQDSFDKSDKVSFMKMIQKSAVLLPK